MTKSHQRNDCTRYWRREKHILIFQYFIVWNMTQAIYSCHYTQTHYEDIEIAGKTFIQYPFILFNPFDQNAQNKYIYIITIRSCMSVTVVCVFFFLKIEKSQACFTNYKSDLIKCRYPYN